MIIDEIKLPNNLQRVAVLKDNYSWIIWNNGKAIIIDPGDAAPIQKTLEAHPSFSKLEAILITHHHHDHIGGVAELMNTYHPTLYGPKNIEPKPDIILSGSEIFELLSYKIHVFPTAGHAAHHLSYYIENIPALFCGDVLFSGGCGRLLEGTATELFHSMRFYDPLPDETLLCAGHDYTESNLKFIAHYQKEFSVLEGKEEKLKDYISYITHLRKEGKATLPSTLKTERHINPFLLAPTPEILAKMRVLKDNF